VEQLDTEINNNEEHQSNQKINPGNFRRVFNTISKLNKSVNVFNGNNLDMDQSNSFLNFHASINDLNALVTENLRSSDTNPTTISPPSSPGSSKPTDSTKSKSSTISLCSNMMQRVVSSPSSSYFSSSSSLKPFGQQTHSTMLLEHNGVKIGFMALYGRSVHEQLTKALGDTSIEYIDFVTVAERLSRQLRQSGATLIVALVNMIDEADETRLMLEELVDVDVVFGSHSGGSGLVSCRSNIVTLSSGQQRTRWVVKGSADLNDLSLVKLKMSGSRLCDISIVKYFIE
jgi:hypothetical protein